MKIPSWINIRNLRTSADDTDSPWFGDAGLFWRFRAIYHPTGLDYVPNRGGFTEGMKTEARHQFIRSVLESASFRKWVKEQWPGSQEVFCADGNVLHLRATNNRSYGYTYLWAWQDKEQS